LITLQEHIQPISKSNQIGMVVKVISKAYNWALAALPEGWSIWLPYYGRPKWKKQIL
jgi:hypothetical protein